MPGSELFQSFDCFEGVFGHPYRLLNGTDRFEVVLFSHGIASGSAMA
jgi:hypothetical protein